MNTSFGQSTLSNYMRIGNMATGSAPTSSSSDIADIHYFFNNDATDSSGNGYDAITTNMVYSTTNPAQGTHCGTFTSTSTLFQVPDGYTWSSPFSISLWFRTTAASGTYPEFMSPYKENSGWEYWRLWLRGDSQNVEFRGYQNSTGTLDLANTYNSVWTNDNSWHHLVFTYNNGTCAFYVDGTESINSAGTWDTDNMKLDNTGMHIGQYFNGGIDDFSVYSQVLTQTQVTTLYNSGTAGTVLTA